MDLFWTSGTWDLGTFIDATETERKRDKGFHLLNDIPTVISLFLMSL